MTTAVDKARARGAGHEVVCVSHQLPVWTAAAAPDRQAALARPAATGVRARVGDHPGLRRRPAGRRASTANRRALDHVAAGDRRGGVGCRLLAGCSGRDAVAQGGTFEFVSPGGKTDIFYDPPASRGRPGPLSGPDLADPARTLSLDDPLRRPGRRHQRLGAVVRAVPGRGHPTAAGVRRHPRPPGCRSWASTSATTTARRRQDFVDDRHVTFPSIYDPAMRTLIAFGGKYPTTVIPSTLVLDRQHRVAAVFLRELLAEDLQPVVQRVAQRPRRARRHRDGNDRLHRDRRRRAAAAGAGGVPAGGAGVVRLAVRGAAGAGLPVVSGRGRRRRTSSRRRARSRPRRPPGGGSRDRRRCSSPGSPRCSCSAPSPCWA